MDAVLFAVGRDKEATRSKPIKSRSDNLRQSAFPDRDVPAGFYKNGILSTFMKGTAEIGILDAWGSKGK